MQVDIIEDFERFRALKENWERVYEVDPEAQFFSSWTWLAQRLDDRTEPWFILAAKARPEASAYVAFLPLRMRTLPRERRAGFIGEVTMAAAPVADYTGMLCRPGCEARAIPALAARLQQLHWARLSLPNFVASPQRSELLFRSFSETLFLGRNVKLVRDGDGINNFVCPYVPLADDWDSFLAMRLGSNTRQKARRFLRKLGGADDLHITHADAATITRDIDILLRFWTLKWGARKGDRIDAIEESLRTILSESFESGVLFMPVLWQGERPLGALGCFVDEVRGAMLFFIGGRDESINNPPPGFVLHAYALRHAVELGFKSYDFLRGNEPYKYLFATEERSLENIALRTRTGDNLGARLDIRSVPFALAETRRLHAQGLIERARIGYHQILEADPDCREAQVGFAEIRSTLRERRTGDAVIRQIVEARRGVSPA